MQEHRRCGELDGGVDGEVVLRPATRFHVRKSAGPCLTFYWVGYWRAAYPSGGVRRLSVLATIRSRQMQGGRVLAHSSHVPFRSLPSKEDEVSVCVICKRPIDPGAGRFRTEKGDAHDECYRRTQRGR
jgi:hypothetical protein